MPQGPDVAVDRPGALRRAAAGAWHVLAGFGHLIRNPSLWGLAALPAALALVLIVAGALLSYYVVFPWVEAAVVPGRGRFPDVLRFLMTLVLWAATVGAGMAAGLAVSLLLSSPILERLSRVVEARARGKAIDQAPGLGWEIAQSLRGAAYFLAAVPGVFFLGLIPLAGPILAALWGAYALAFQHTDAPLARRGLGFGQRREWHRRWRAESLGFGLAGLVVLAVPLANFLLGPALAAGGTLLVLELEEGLSPGASAKAEPAAAR